MNERRVSINEIIDEILAEASENRRPLVIFDLDSTLYNVSLRTQAIVDAFVRDAEMRLRFAKEIEFLSALKISPRDWGIRQALERAGIQSSEEFRRTIRDFWRTRFFSSEFLHADRPYPGSREGVARLHSAGAEILYLTGRDERNMKSGTIESLIKWGFPLRIVDGNPANLIMKPVKGSIEDEDFKEVEIQKIAKKFHDLNSEIWFFENEPLIIERVRRATPFVRIVWADTTHSGRANAPTDLPIIEWLK